MVAPRGVAPGRRLAPPARQRQHAAQVRGVGRQLSGREGVDRGEDAAAETRHALLQRVHHGRHVALAHAPREGVDEATDEAGDHHDAQTGGGDPSQRAAELERRVEQRQLGAEKAGEDVQVQPDLHRAGREHVATPGQVREVERHQQRPGVAEPVAQETARPEELVVGMLDASLEPETVEGIPAP